MTKPIYAIGDIHGHPDELDAALARIERDGGPGAHIVFLGDYTDRGPDSRAVIDRLITGQAEGRNWTCLRGNHDRMMALFCGPYPQQDNQLLLGYHWLHPRIGGVETLASYGVAVPDGIRTYQLHEQVRAAVPQAHLDFLAGLQNFHEAGDLLFVHAGIRPGVALQDQKEDDLIWIRGAFLDDPRPHPWLVVHGHTHVPTPEHHGNRVNLDSGAGYGHPLTAAVFEKGEVSILTDNGRERLTP
ncbi:MAG: serine/threonine protein phosphatase [Rhodobacterales bacterium]|nr:MAG: serine/threonine protein phosphatase [Rhodobacterales bacterium]